MEIDLPFEPAEYERLKRVGHYFQSRDEPAVAAGIYADLLGQPRQQAQAQLSSEQDLDWDILLTASYFHKKGELALATQLYRELTSRPSPPVDAYNLLGYALCQQGRPAEGLQQVAMAVALKPHEANFHNHLGLALQALGEARWEDAVRAYLRALDLDRAHVNAMDNLLALLERLPAPNEAALRLLQLWGDEPSHQSRQLRLGALFERHQQHDAAAAAYETAATLAPRDVAPLLSLGRLHQVGKQLERACNVYERVLAIEPGHGPARERLADCEAEMGEFDRAMGRLETLYSERPSPRLRARIDLALPSIPQSSAHVEAIRARLETQLDRYLAMDEAPPDLLLQDFFYLAYHGRNDRDILCKAALLARKTMPRLVYTAPFVHGWRGPERRIRLGVASSLLCDHSIGRTTRGILEKLDRSRFELVLICLPPRRSDRLALAIRGTAAAVLDLRGDLDEDRRAIAELRLDAIFYPDIGMDLYQSMLAHARLAPLQATHFGHPETTGLPTIDWWISVDALEPPNAQEHYCEALHLLRDVPHPSYYYRPPLPPVLRTRQEFGFADAEHLYICPQYLFKIHPEFDEILEQILRRDASARILLTRSPVAYWSTVVLRRLERRIGALVQRITCLPAMPTDQLMNLERVCDAVLDTIHFNGFNTTLEAWAAGAPVVTLPGAMQRGRHTAGMYRHMGMEELIAATPQDYVDLVLRLGSDRAFGKAVRDKLAARSHVLFENIAVVREYERFFEEKLAQIASHGFAGRENAAPADVLAAA